MTGSSSSKLKNLLELLKSEAIDSLDELQINLQSPAEKTLLKCASLLRNFDRQIFARLSRALPLEDAAPSFEQFTRNPELEPVPRTENVFRIKPHLQQNYLLEWSRELAQPQPGIGTDFLDQLISYYRMHEDRHGLDLLGVLIVSAPEKARDKFLELFAEADRNFNLARSSDIVKTLEERLPLLDLENEAAAELFALSREKRQYLKARTLFSAEYYQTVFYYARKSVERQFDHLLKENKTRSRKWIFHLYAPGGSGKTMFVRWLIARHFVPEPRRIPVARLDFDFLHLPMIEHHPWLLILAVAEQLNQQLEGNPFNEHLTDYWHFVSLARPPKDVPGDDSRANKEKLIKQIKPQDVETIVNRFIDALNELETRKPFVIVLDTLERMVLYYKTSLLAALKFLEKIHEHYPQMRLLLSGRYNLQERLTEFSTRYREQTVLLELTPFSRREASDYLEEKRRLGAEPIIKAIIEKCAEVKTSAAGESAGCNPFKLSLIADFYQQEVVTTPQEILSLERTDVEYLINRIITHIKEPPVQWLLRYAVVPRRFTYDIFEKVLFPRLIEELANNGLLDQPNRNFPKGAEKFENQENWKQLSKGENYPLEPQKIWNDLRNYASSQSWISFDAGDDAAPQLHSDIVVPMRHLLETQEPIFKQLHGDAARYFESKAAAERDPQLWGQYVCEFIYHRFQKNGAAAAAVWREKLDSAVSQTNPSVRKMLAEEITRGDYVRDETKTPLVSADQTLLVNYSDLHEAHLRAIESAIASLAGLRPDEQNGVWVGVREHFADLERLKQRKIPPGEKYRPPFDESLLRRLTTQINKTRGSDQKAISLLREAIDATASRQMLLSFEIMLGDLLANSNAEEALKHYENALKIRGTIKSNEIQTAEIRLKIGHWHQNRSDFESAERVYRNLLVVAKNENNSPVIQKTLRRLVELNEIQARYDECLGLLRKIRQSTENDAEEERLHDEIALGRIEARNLFEPLPALARIEPLLKTDRSFSTRAGAAELHGEILGKLMVFERALSELEEAKELWTSALNPVGADHARMLRIELHLLGIGDYQAAGSIFDAWERIGTKTDPELTCRLQLLRVLFDERRADRSRARSVWLKIMRDERLRQSTRCLVRALATGLALNLGDASSLGALVAELAKIEPPSARLPLLEVFKYSEQVMPTTPAERETMKKLIAVESRGRDVIPHSLIRAAVLAVCGETDLAEKLLNEAAHAARRQKNSFALREILLVKDRLKISPAPGDDLFTTDFLNDFAIYPHLCAAACLEQAARFLKRENIDGCRQAVERAREFLLKAETSANQWRAKYDELWGELAEREGDASAARTHFNRALSIYKKLGDKPAADRLRARLPRISHAPVGEDEIFTVRLEPTAKTLVFDYRSNRDFKDRQKFAPASDDLFSKTITSNAGDDTLIYTFSKLYLDSPGRIETEMGKLLFSGSLAALIGKNRRNQTLPDYRLEAFAPAAAKIPWELALLGEQRIFSLFRNFYRSTATGNSEQIKWLQIALRHLLGYQTAVDGVFGPHTQQGLKILKKKLKLPENATNADLGSCVGEHLIAGKTTRRTKALLIVPRQDQRVSAQRGLEFYGPAIDWWYEDCDFTVETLWWSDLRQLKDLMRQFQPDVIHIQSTFRLMQNLGQIYLDFGAEQNNAIAQSFSAPDSEFIQPSVAFLNDALALLPDSKLRPLVILDAICPPGITETMRQLLYRNAFAAGLFQLGNASSVIAAGLCASPKLQGEITPALIPALSNTENFGAIVNALRKLPINDAPEEKIATLGVALFTNEPLLTVLSNENK